MFGLFGRGKDNKRIRQALEIVGKALVLHGYSADHAFKLAQAALNQVVDDDTENLPKPWVLAVISVHQLRVALEGASDPDFEEVLPDLRAVIDLSMDNARSEASSTDNAVLDLIEEKNNA